MFRGTQIVCSGMKRHRYNGSDHSSYQGQAALAIVCHAFELRVEMRWRQYGITENVLLLNKEACNVRKEDNS